MRAQEQRNGFTLVELAISLMVIGLLIGGVLKGQELLANARLTALVRQIEGYKTAVAAFESGYDAIPGDVPDAIDRLPACRTSPCGEVNSLAGMIGNGMLDHYLGSPPGWFSHTHPYIIEANSLRMSSEWRNFWVHLVKTGLVQENIDTTTPISGANLFNFSMVPETPIKNIYLGAVTYTGSAMTGAAAIIPSTWLYTSAFGNGSRNLTPRQVYYVDNKMDDGKPLSGAVRIGPSYSSASTYMGVPRITFDTTCLDSTQREYNVASTTTFECGLVYNIQP